MLDFKTNVPDSILTEDMRFCQKEHPDRSKALIKVEKNAVEWLGLGTHLFVKVISRPGDSEGPFWPSSQAATCYSQSSH